MEKLYLLGTGIHEVRAEGFALYESHIGTRLARSLWARGSLRCGAECRVHKQRDGDSSRVLLII